MPSVLTEIIVTYCPEKDCDGDVSSVKGLARVLSFPREHPIASVSRQYGTDVYQYESQS